MDKWTRERPKKEGTYWFYGERWKMDTKKMYIIEFLSLANGNVMPTHKGNFLSKDIDGDWVEIKKPEPPETGYNDRKSCKLLIIR